MFDDVTKLHRSKTEKKSCFETDDYYPIFIWKTLKLSHLLLSQHAAGCHNALIAQLQIPVSVAISIGNKNLENILRCEIWTSLFNTILDDFGRIYVLLIWKFTWAETG